MPTIESGMESAPQNPPAAEASIHEAIARIGQLPVLDRALRRVRELAADPDSDTNELVSALEADPGLAANILRFANSAACARPIRAQTVRQAVALVGRVHVGRLAVEAAVCRFFELAPGTGGASRGLLHVHASQVAAVAGALAERAGADAEAAHLAGLLHDLGKLVMPLAFGEDELDAVAHEHPIGRARALLERERFGVDHAHAGAVFAREAFLEARVFNAIGAHHSTDIPSPEAACVQVADAAVHLLLDLRADAEVLDGALEELGMSAAVLEDVVPVALPTLAPSVGGLAGRVAALERAATTDQITGLLTRSAWIAAVRQKLEVGRAGVVLVADVQGLRALDERHGYAAGNVVLCELARILGRRGIAGRLGGDELALFAPIAPAEGDALVAAVHADVAAGLAERGVVVEVLLGSAPAPLDADAHAVLHAATAAVRQAGPSHTQRAA
jgi:putative nucleotidyltransferase with HDIG domain/diguanylate cyclase (GGDEF)-like protein